MNKLIVLIIFLLMTSCKKDEPYKTFPIEVFDAKDNRVKDEISVGLDYIVKKDTNIYYKKDDKAIFDTLKKNSLVRVILEEEDGFVYVRYLGQEFYIRVDDLEEI